MNKPTAFAFTTVWLLSFSAGCFSADGLLDSTAAKCVTPDDADRLVDQTLQLVNLERAERALPPVVVNARLQKIAEDYACRMVELGFFGHTDPFTGDKQQERALAGKYWYYALGENLAAGSSTAADVMKRWMESPRHRDVILDPTWKEIGIGVRAGSDGQIHWVQQFGDPAGPIGR
ncbi:MAG: CAP domain-containing protein [Phycisphaerae bacterium]